MRSAVPLLASLLAALPSAGCAHRARTAPDALDGVEVPREVAVAGGQGEGAVVSCGPWAGVVRVGTRWTYAPTEAYVTRWGFDGTFDRVVAAIDGDHVTLVEEGAYEGPGGRFRWWRRDVWRCDAAGAWWVRSDARTRGAAAGRALGTRGWRTFGEGWLVRPASMEPWDDSFPLTISLNGGAPTSTTATCTTTLGEASTREVDGRAVTVHAIVPRCVGVPAEAMWLGEGVGLVENADERLIRYQP